MPQKMISPQSELHIGKSKYVEGMFVDYLFILDCISSLTQNCSI